MSGGSRLFAACGPTGLGNSGMDRREDQMNKLIPERAYKLYHDGFIADDVLDALASPGLWGQVYRATYFWPDELLPGFVIQEIER